MTKQARRLGRGLDSLVSDLRGRWSDTAVALSERPQAGSAASAGLVAAGPGGAKGRVAMVPIDALRPNPYQPRDTEGLEVGHLAESVRTRGILQPIVVRPVRGATTAALRPQSVGATGEAPYGARVGATTEAPGMPAAGAGRGTGAAAGSADSALDTAPSSRVAQVFRPGGADSRGRGATAGEPDRDTDTAPVSYAAFEIIAGERRWRAARQAGLTEVPVVIREADDREMLELALIENLEREDLNPIERAHAYREHTQYFGEHPEVLAERLGEDRTTVVNYLRLLDLSADIQALIASRALGMGHARCLLGVRDEARRGELARAAAAGGLSVRALEELVRRAKAREPGGPAVGTRRDPRSAVLREAERRFEETLRTRVRIREGKRKGSGRLVIDYHDLHEFERIAERLGVSFD